MISINFALLVAGALIVIKGADFFTDGAIHLARITRLPEVVIGATLVSMTTTLPEFSVSIYAAHGGHTGMAVGNAVGSILCNSGLILGGAVLVKGFRVSPRLFRQEAVFMLGAAFLLMLISLDGRISLVEGWVLLSVFAGYMLTSVILARRGLSGGDTSRSQGGPGQGIGRFLMGGLMIGLGSRLLVSSGTYLAEALGISEMFLGLTIIAIGTSLPELVTALTALVKGHEGLSVGNVLGANFLNITWVTGSAALLRELPVSPTTLRLDLPAMLIMVTLVFFFGRTRKRLDRWEGGVLVLIYGIYMVYRSQISL